MMHEKVKEQNIIHEKGKKVRKSFEEILEECGGFGMFQFLALAILLLPEIPAAFVAFAPVFVNRSVSSWTCYDEKGNNITTPGSTDICECPGIVEIDNPEFSIVSEWGLVCQNSWVSDSITSIQMLGMLVGSLFSSQISDWYGRKWVYIVVCMLMAVGQALSAVAPNPIVYAFSRFLAGAGVSGFMGMSTVYPLEFMTPNYRLLIGSVGPWGEGIMLFALLAYYVNPWRELLAYSVLPFAFVFLVVPFFPESPRYLLRQGRVQEALDVVRTIQKFNRKKDVVVTYEMLEEIADAETKSSSSTKRYSYLEFFRQKELCRKTLLLMGIWFSWALVYFGISYNIKNLRGNIYLNVAFMGLSDALGYPAALLINNRLGRRKSLVIFMMLGAAFLVALAAVDLIYGSLVEAGWIALLCLSGKFGFAGARSAARMLTGESFPTAIRTMGYGISGVTAGVGGVLAPQVAYIGSLWWGPLPFVTFAAISVAGSLLSLLLPETAGQSLQEETGLVTKKVEGYKSTSCAA